MKEKVLFKYPNKEDKIRDLVRLWTIKNEGNEKSFYSWLISSDLFWDGFGLSLYEPKILWMGYHQIPGGNEWKVGTMAIEFDIEL